MVFNANLTIGESYTREQIERLGLTLTSFEADGTMNYMSNGIHNGSCSIHIFTPAENDLSNGKALKYVGKREPGYKLEDTGKK